MKISIIGDGSFGSFLKELLAPHFEIEDDADTIILAVPISAYDELGREFRNRHLINVCSVQKPSTDILLKYSRQVTSIHPLFGKRTPADKRNSIFTYSSIVENDTWQSDFAENDFLQKFSNISKIISENYDGKVFTPESHDILMRKTHVNALIAAKQMKVFIDVTDDIPDKFIPNSFRLMRQFVKTLDDMPKGTTESIMANPYF